MNSGGIGLLVTLLVRANRHSQQLLAFGLSDHYAQIFELTRLDEAVGIHDDRVRRAGRGGRRIEEPHMSDVNEKAAARDATNWAKTVSTLNVAEVPEGAVAINVEGKRLAGPIQGFGKMWQKTYQVRLPQRDGVGRRT